MTAPRRAIDENAAGSAESHIDVGADAPAAGGAAVKHQAGEDVVALPAEELVAVRCDGPGGPARNDAGGEAVGAGPHPGFAPVMQQLQHIAAGQDALAARISNVEQM